MKVSEIVDQLQINFPEKIASKGDPVGIQLGSLEQTVTKVLVTLDVRPNVVKEAIEKGSNLIISHHPLMFHPASNLDFKDPQNKMYGDLIKHGITVYSLHTNSDKAQNGSSDWQAEKLALTKITPFCLDDDGLAIGRKGKLPKIMSAKEFAYYVKEKLQVKMVRLITANDAKQIETVGFVCGDGGKFWKRAVDEHLDAFITGDIYYHTGHDIISSGLTVVDPGHYAEKLFKYRMFDLLKKWQQSKNWPIEIQLSKVSTNPFEDLF